VVSKRSVSYRLEADRNGLQLTLDETFWPDTTDDEGNSRLDFNIALVLEEIKAALYYVEHFGRPKH
jgi:hypothetical protein